MADLTATGTGGQIDIEGDFLTIRSKGGLAKLRHGLAGEKRIPIANITSVQFKKAGVVEGYIQFSLLGGAEAKRGVQQAARDENTVTFSFRHTAEFGAIRDYIEARIGGGAFGGRPAAPPASAADELRKLADLRAEGLISDAEFEAQKAKLLG